MENVGEDYRIVSDSEKDGVRHITAVPSAMVCSKQIDLISRMAICTMSSICADVTVTCALSSVRCTRRTRRACRPGQRSRGGRQTQFIAFTLLQGLPSANWYVALVLDQDSAFAALDEFRVSRDKAGRHWYLLRAELTGSAFDPQRSPALVAELARLSRELEDHFPGAQLLVGAPSTTATYAAAVARQDISTNGQ